MLSSSRSTALLALLTISFTRLCHTQSIPLNLLYQFPTIPYTNIENLAVRTRVGTLLLNTVTGPLQYELNPSTGAAPAVTASLNGRGPESLIGIAETYPGSDVFIVSAGNFSYGPQVPGGVAGVPGSFSAWRFDYTSGKAVTTQIAAIPEANSLNGLAVLNENTVLIVDSGLGAIWAVDTTTGVHTIAIQSPLWLPTPYFSLGINGIKIRGNTVYWTNSAFGTFGKVQVNKDGTAAGPVEVIASAPTGLSFDDFALDWQGNAWVAGPPNALIKVGIANGNVEVVAGGGTNQTLVGPTSVALNRCTLYVATGGSGGQSSGQVFEGNVCGSNMQFWEA